MLRHWFRLYEYICYQLTGSCLKFFLICLSCIVVGISAKASDEKVIYSFDTFGRQFDIAPADQPLFPQAFARTSAAGTFSAVMVGAIDSVHPYGTEGGIARSQPTLATDLIYEKLFTLDPTSASSKRYPGVARAIRLPADLSYVVFEINPEARFQDGNKVTGEDIRYSYDVLINSHPKTKDEVGRVVESIETSANEVRFNLKLRGQAVHEAIVNISDIVVVRPNTTGNNKVDGIAINYTGTGPYRITQLSRSKITLIRDPYYWAENLPHRLGMFNFRQVEVSSYFDQTIARLAFMGGRANFFTETSPMQARAIANHFSTQSNRIREHKVPVNPITAKFSFVFNLDEPQLKDVRVRQALMVLFDFNLTNHIYFGGDYKQPTSLLDDSELAPRGEPSPAVKEILAQCPLPAEAYGPFENYGTTLAQRHPNSRIRKLTAMKLFNEAGYVNSQGQLAHVDENGRKTPLRLMILVFTDAHVRLMSLYKQALVAMGIDVEIRLAQSAEHFMRMSVENKYSLAYANTGVLEQDIWPIAEYFRYEYHSSLVRPGELSVLNSNRMRMPCVDKIIDELIAERDRFGARYRDLVDALARIQQVLALGIFQGHPKNFSVFMDERILVPKGISPKQALWFGRWSENGGKSEETSHEDHSGEIPPIDPQDCVGFLCIFGSSH